MNASSDGRVLWLQDVHKRYGTVPALSGLELQLSPGQVYGFLGRNGAGKSTALRIVMGITRADRGSVALFGEPVKPGNVRARQRIGYVAQEQHFYPWMTPERLGAFVGAFYPRWDKQHYARLITSFELPPRKVATYSGGMKVKLALALALAHHPELLVLDEPTAGLDAVVRREFIDILQELAVSGQHTTLFSSHLIDEVEMVASRVGIVEQGSMRFEGSLPELAARSRVMSLVRQGDGTSQPALPEVLSGLGELKVRVLGQRDTAAQFELALWSEDPLRFSAVQQRWPDARFRQPALEDMFIALVRRGSLKEPAGPA